MRPVSGLARAHKHDGYKIWKEVTEYDRGNRGGKLSPDTFGRASGDSIAGASCVL
jgi:hypothetical protein